MSGVRWKCEILDADEDVIISADGDTVGEAAAGAITNAKESGEVRSMRSWKFTKIYPLPEVWVPPDNHDRSEEWYSLVEGIIGVEEPA